MHVYICFCFLESFPDLPDERINRMKTRFRSKLLLFITLALVLVISILPVNALAAVSENPAAGVFIRDAGTDFFNMEGESQNGNVVARVAWRYGDYVYFALNCQKNVSVDPAEFKINGVNVGEDNFWLLGEDVSIKLYEGPDASEPSVTLPPDNGGQPRIWIVGRILLSNSSLELDFENLSHAGGWEVHGVTIEAALMVTHQYGSAEPRPDFDQSASQLTAGAAMTISPVPEGDYVFSSVTVKFGDTEITDLASKGITNNDGVLTFTVTDEMVASGNIYVEYVYELPPATYPLTIHYQYEDGTEAAADHTESLAEGADYSVDSPEIENYTPDQATVSGTMPAEAVEVTVVYTENEEESTEESTEPSEDPTEPSKEPTEPSTEPSEDPTEPPEEPTEPSTEPTEAPTQPSTEPTEASTQPATEPAGPVTGDVSRPIMWLSLSVMALLGIGTAAFMKFRQSGDDR